MDVKNAFLQGTLEEEVYMTLPPGHKKEKDSNLVCRLKKSIYRLKQSPRAWYEKLSSYLIFCNFNVSNADHSLFIKNIHGTITVVLVYVDDIIVTGDSQEEIEKIKNQLKEKFDIKDLGVLKYFLGIPNLILGLLKCQFSIFQAKVRHSIIFGFKDILRLSRILSERLNADSDDIVETRILRISRTNFQSIGKSFWYCFHHYRMSISSYDSTIRVFR